MALTALVVIGVVVVAAILVAAFAGGSRAMPWVLGGVALVILGGAGVFLLGRTSTVRSGPAPTVVVAAPAATASAPERAPEAPVRTLRGRVLRGAEGETPVPGAAVEVFAADAVPVPFSQALGVVSTDPDGRFTIERMPALAVRVRASAPGTASAVATKPADDEAEIVLRLHPGAVLAGRVTDRETKEAIAGARVSVGRVGADAAVGALSGDDGAFRIEGVPRGGVTVVATAKDYARHRDGVDLPEWGRTDLAIRLRPGGAVSGRVLLPDGKPAPGARVDVAQMLEIPVVGETAVPVDADPAIADAAGAWRIEGLPVKRELRFTASTSDLLGAPTDAAALEKGEERTGVDLQLEPGGAVAVLVRDPAGAPIEGATVSAAPPDEEGRGNLGMMRIPMASTGATATTAADGKAVVRPLRAGVMKVEARKQDWRDGSAPAVVVVGTETPLSLVLEPGAWVSGRVVDATGAGVPGASVTARNFGGGGVQESESRVSAEDGAFRIGGLSSRPMMVRAEKEGFVPSSLNNIQPGTADLVVTISPAGGVSGTVTDPEGRPMPRFRAMARKEGEPGANPMDWERFAAERAGTEFHDGRFRIGGLAPGRYEIEARGEGFAPGRAKGVVVEPAGDATVAIVLAAGESLSGVVTVKGAGSPVAGARVRIPAEGMFGEFDMDMDMSALEDIASDDVEQARSLFGAFGKGEAVSGADGRFRLQGLETGTLRLMVTAKGHAPVTVRGIEIPASQEVKIEVAEESAVEGRVTDAAGAPRQGITIMIQRMPMFMRFAGTDADGRYRIGGLGAGSYLFYAMDPAAGFNLRSETVMLEEGKTTRKDHKLGEGTKVVGTVTRGGKPVDGVMVMLVPTARSGGPMGMLTGGGGGGFCMGSTKGDGTYEITGVPAGRYTVTIQSSMGGTPGGSETIEIARGATDVRHEVVLPEAAIRGTVKDEEGKPVVGAAITAFVAGMDGGRITDLGSTMQGMGGQAFSDDTGAFLIADMPAGSYRLRVQADGRGTEIVENVSSTAGAPVSVVMRAGAEFTVKVVSPDGAPVRGATVFLEDAEGRELTNISNFDALRTNDQGRATLRAPPGSLTVEATAKGFAPGSLKVTIPSSEEITVRLVRASSLKLRVTGAGGTPVAGAGVEILDADGKPYGHRFSMEGISDLLTGASTAADGTWTRGELPAGTWRVRAVTQDGKSAEEKVVLAEGETAEVVLRLN